MPNAYANKVQVTRGGQTETLIDLTADTAIASDVAQGKYFHLASGERVVGTATGGGGGGAVYQDQDGYIVLSDQGGGSSVTVEALSVTQNGTYTAPTGKAYSPVTVSVSGGGGGSGSMSDPIRFFDYDGTLVASYSSAPSALPSVPAHVGLTNGTWNYTLQQVTTQFNAMGACDVGANYETTSGSTEISITLVDSVALSPYLQFAVNGTVTIDWGDESTTSSMTGTSLTGRKSIQHTYASVGSYTIKLTPATGTTYSMYGTSAYTLLNANGNTQNINRKYANCVHAIRLGDGCSIGDYAFCGCSSLTSVTIPSSVTSIGNYAFQYCYSLASPTIPSGVARIGNYAFQNCYSFVSLAIPSSVTSIGTYAFQYCYSLASLTIPSSVTSIDGSAFSNCTSLTSLTIPSGVTVINASVFSGCASLTSVTIPSGVTVIGAGMFQNCYCLTPLTIPSGVTSIGVSAFYNCYSLTSLTIPSEVASIGNNAFSNCYGMMEYHFKRTESVPTLGTTAFSSIQSGCKIYVPSSKLSDYQTAANWSTYASYMVGE